MRRLAPALVLLSLLGLPGVAHGRARAGATYYVSLGDSMSQGAQPIGPGGADEATDQGFTDDLYRSLRRPRPGLKLVKLGCGGATVESMRFGSRPCREPLPYRSASPATSQLRYAESFLRRHRGRIALVTVIIGGNDVARCIGQPGLAAIDACITEGLTRIKAGLPAIARALRRAAGRRVTIVGSTYADALLGQYVKGSPSYAALSVDLFRRRLNPLLRSIYRAQRIRFVDATAGFDGYVPFSRTTELAPYGRIPQAVARICELAWYCQTPDIHLRPAGYAKLAGLFERVIGRPRLG